MTFDPADAHTEWAEAVTLRCRTVASGGLRQKNYIRDLPPILFEERFGAPDAAKIATPSEAFLAALGSCLSAHILANAAAASIIVHSLELDVQGDLAPGAIWRPEGQVVRAVGFDEIRVTVHVIAAAGSDALRAMIAHAARSSPVANTLHDPAHLNVVFDRFS